MGNISNLATTGNYTTEVNGIKVSFNFEVDNKTAKLRKFDGGSAIKDEMTIATFNKEMYGGVDSRNRINFGLERGYEIEAVTAVIEAISSLEAKITKGEEVSPVVE